MDNTNDSIKCKKKKQKLSVEEKIEQNLGIIRDAVITNYKTDETIKIVSETFLLSCRKNKVEPIKYLIENEFELPNVMKDFYIETIVSNCSIDVLIYFQETGIISFSDKNKGAYFNCELLDDIILHFDLSKMKDNNCEKIFEYFIDKKFDINYQNIFDMILINGSIDTLKKIIPLVDININDGMALLYCCEKKLYEKIDVLLEAGALIDVYKKHPKMFVNKKDLHYIFIKMYLSPNGEKQNYTPFLYFTPIMYAIYHEDFDLLKKCVNKFVIEKKETIFTTKYPQNPLLYAVQIGCKKIINYLIDISGNYFDNDITMQWNLIANSFIFGHFDIFDTLFQKFGHNFDLKELVTTNYYSPLYVSIEKGNEFNVKNVLNDKRFSKNIDINYFFLASVEQGLNDLPSYFLKLGADIHYKDDICMIFAASNNNSNTFMLLEDAGGNINLECPFNTLDEYFESFGEDTFRRRLKSKFASVMLDKKLMSMTFDVKQLSHYEQYTVDKLEDGSITYFYEKFEEEKSIVEYFDESNNSSVDFGNEMLDDLSMNDQDDSLVEDNLSIHSEENLSIDADNAEQSKFMEEKVSEEEISEQLLEQNFSILSNEDLNEDLEDEYSDEEEFYYENDDELEDKSSDNVSDEEKSMKSDDFEDINKWTHKNINTEISMKGYNALLIFFLNGNDKMVKYLMNKNTDVHVLNDILFTESVFFNKYKLSNQILKIGNIKKERIDSAFYLFLDKNSQKSNIKFYETMLDNDFETPDKYAVLLARNGRKEYLNILIQKRGVSDDDLEESFIQAAVWDQVNVVRYLIHKGISIFCRDNAALYLSAKYTAQVFMYLCDKWKKETSIDQDILNKCLCSAAKYNALHNLKYAVNLGADIHTNDDYAFRASAYYGHIESINYLLEKGANIHAKNDFALNYAIKYNMEETIEILKTKGAVHRPILFDDAPEGFKPRYNTHCPISLEKIDYHSNIKYLVCGNCRNAFDYDSLSKWLSEHESCPSCRTKNSYSRKKRDVFRWEKGWSSL